MITRSIGLSVLAIVAGCHSSTESTTSEVQTEASLACPRVVTLGISGLAVSRSFDLGTLSDDCKADRLADPCTAYYAREVEEVATELRALSPMEVTLERASALVAACKYAPAHPAAGQVNAIEIRRDHGQLVVSAAYSPARPHTFGNVFFDASAVRVTADELVVAEGPGSITDATGPYSYSYVSMGTATIVSR